MIPCPCKQPFPRNFCLVQWVGYREIFISACFALGGIRIWLGAIAGGCSSVHLIGSIVGPLFVIPSSATWWILSVASASFSGVCASLSVIRRCPILMGNYNRWITPLFLWDSWFSLIDIHSAAISRIINHHDSYFDKRSPPPLEKRTKIWLAMTTWSWRTKWVLGACVLIEELVTRRRIRHFVRKVYRRLSERKLETYPPMRHICAYRSDADGVIGDAKPTSGIFARAQSSCFGNAKGVIAAPFHAIANGLSNR